ncbi:MAG: DUF4097 family beta strand repeat-containing protein [Candidatus Izemoplasma sp.]|nr:DUF4097 family beta strand repeat-containing protein [Candidatus Izemoplasma sp.]
MKNYLKGLKEEMFKEGLKDEVINEVIKDHEEMIEAALEEGLDETALEEKFGNPKDIAQAISADTTEEESYDDEQGYRLLETYAINGDDIDIEVKLLNESLEVTQGKGTGIEVYVREMPNISEYDIGCDGETFTIKRKNSFFISFRKKHSAKFRVLLPADLVIDAADINITNGKVSLKKLQSNNLKLKTVNGNISLKYMTDNHHHLTTVNGKIKLSNITAKKTFVSQVSGSTKMKHVTVEKDIHVRSVSGDVDLKDVTAKDVEYHSVSGSLKGKEVYPENISLRSVSGDIYIKNTDKDHDVNIKSKKSVSGNITFE